MARALILQPHEGEELYEGGGKGVFKSYWCDVQGGSDRNLYQDCSLDGETRKRRGGGF